MAATDSFERFPVWQRIVLFILVAAAIVVCWFYFFYQEAVAGHDAAKMALTKAGTDLQTATDDKDKFSERQKQTDAVEKELQASMEVLPMSTAAVDNLMQTFQQQARLVGLTVEAWTPSKEEKLDYYAKLPVKVKATGTWAQAGEFFRRVSELDRPVSVEGVKLIAREVREKKEESASGEPTLLDVEFEVTTYRFLPAEERAAAAEEDAKKPPSRRKK